MFLKIKQLLAPAEIARLTELASELQFVEGRVSNPANTTKDNLQAAENPLLAVLVGFGIGYALAYMIHAGGSNTNRVPDYGKRRSS